MPRVERHQPVHLQIALYYRKEITEGRLLPGSRLPSVRDMASAAGTGQNSAQRAVEYLKSEGLVRTDSTGTYVTSSRTALGPQQRLHLAEDPATEEILMRSAALAGAPDYVAALLGLDSGAQAVRREQVVRRPEDGSAHMLSVSWCPPDIAGPVPELLQAAPLPDPAGPAHLAAARTGTLVDWGRASVECRTCSPREAVLLGLEPGSPVLAAVYYWATEERVLEYTENVLPAGQKLGFDLEP